MSTHINNVRDVIYVRDTRYRHLCIWKSLWVVQFGLYLCLCFWVMRTVLVTVGEEGEIVDIEEYPLEINRKYLQGMISLCDAIRLYTIF